MTVKFSTPLDKLAETRALDIPTNIVSQLSPYHYDWDCFVDQKLSRDLQVFLVNYVFNTNSYYNLTG